MIREHAALCQYPKERYLAARKVLSVRPRSVTDVATDVGEGVAGDGQELPRVAIDIEHEPDDTVARAVARLAAGDERAGETIMAVAAGADYEAARSAGIERAIRILGGEALIEMIVPGQDDIDAAILERPPQVAHERLASVHRARREPRMVPVRERTGGAVCREIRTQPALLR